jgi:16S rRNA (uracil1498-N3)-methyltransferase
MQRYFIRPADIQDNRIVISGNDVHHMKQVMRFRPGDQVICCDGEGHDWISTIVEFTPQAVHLQIDQSLPSLAEPQSRITLAQALPKGQRWDLILQKATELGVSRITPFVSARTIVKITKQKVAAKQQRWQRIVKEAAEQSHRGRIPDVDVPLTWAELLERIEGRTTPTLLAYEQGGEPLHTVLEAMPKQPEIMLIIGPEGGFDQQEADEAQHRGARVVTLGKRILRTETAAIATLACLFYTQREFGGE